MTKDHKQCSCNQCWAVNDIEIPSKHKGLPLPQGSWRVKDKNKIQESDSCNVGYGYYLVGDKGSDYSKG